MSKCVEMDLKPTLDELLDTFLNREDVEKLVKAPVRIINLYFAAENEFLIADWLLAGKTI